MTREREPVCVLYSFRFVLKRKSVVLPWSCSRKKTHDWGWEHVTNKLFVGSLAWGTTDQTLGDLFAQAGSVTSSKVITDRNTGRSKGFGFVEMSTPEEAQKAVEMLNGKDLDGRSIVVNEARPQQPRNDNFHQH